jgi:hypothetical protein
MQQISLSVLYLLSRWLEGAASNPLKSVHSQATTILHHSQIKTGVSEVYVGKWLVLGWLRGALPSTDLSDSVLLFDIVTLILHLPNALLMSVT